MRNIYKKMLLAMLAISMLASVGTASSFNSNGENIRDMSFASYWDHANGQMMTVSFAGSAEENQGTLLVFGTAKNEDGKSEMLDLIDKAAGILVFTTPGTSEVITVEDYDGQPYHFSAASLRGVGNVYAVLIRNNGNVSMGIVQYSFYGGSLVLGEEKEIPIMTNDRGSYALQNYEAQKNMVFIYKALAVFNYYSFYVDFGETKEGTLLAFGTDVDENGNLEMVNMGSGLFGDNKKVRCLKNFNDKVFDLPPSDLGGNDGNLFVVLMDDEDGTSIGTIPYYPSSLAFIQGGAAVSPEI